MGPLPTELSARAMMSTHSTIRLPPPAVENREVLGVRVLGTIKMCTTKQLQALLTPLDRDGEGPLHLMDHREQ